MDLLKDLNNPQKEAVMHIDGPLLIIAGAGAGKTRVITHRIAYLIQTGVAPKNILAVTFTNKAANEMKERIFRLRSGQAQNDPLAGGPTVGTFHSICARILRQNARAIGRTRNFSILGEEDSLRNIKNAMKTLEINPKQFQPAKIKSIISRQKSELVKLEEYKTEAENHFFPKTLALVWEEYEKNLKKQDALDFDDLISETVYLFREKPEVLKKYQDQWQYIMVDEYQDTNGSQYAFTKLLAMEHKNICVVGDDDQSIYSWRGANFANIFKFEKDWSGAKIIMLEENYRSHQKILHAANAVISNNKIRSQKKLFSQLHQGENLNIFGASNEAEEAEFVAKKSEELISKGVRPDEIAVLYRANFQSRALEELFLAYNLPYQVVGVKFFERKEIKDIVAYAKAALNPNDILSIQRIINEPPRGLGKSSLLSHFSGHAEKLSADKKKKISEFFDLLSKIREIIEKEPVSKAIKFIIQKTGYENQFREKTEENIMRLDNLRELVALSKKYERMDPPSGMHSFLEEAALMSEQDTIKEKGKAVRLMTVHAAKGLEFKNVFISGMEEGLFPYPDYSGSKDPEEERRLFYVALTRAKEKLFLSFAMERTFFGSRQINKPSRFIEEIPEELLEEAGFEEENLKNIDY